MAEWSGPDSLKAVSHERQEKFLEQSHTHLCSVRPWCMWSCWKSLHVVHSVECLHVMRLVEGHVCTNGLRIHLECIHPFVKFETTFDGYHKCAVLCQECSTSVGRHRSCHMQVSSVLQQYVVDDLLLVAIDMRHQDSRHKTVLEERLFCNLCWLPDGNSSEILVLWKQRNRSVGNPSACRGNLAVPIKHLP